MRDNLIELKGITKQYRMGEVTIDALRGVDFNKKKGVSHLYRWEYGEKSNLVGECRDSH